jgi:hypothetical protein
MSERENESSFFIMSTGQIESGEFNGGVDNMYCRYAFSFGKYVH